MINIHDLLEDAGVESLRETRKEVVGACPKHRERTGKDDVHPSWSINKSTLLHFCFSCGYSGTLTGLLVDLTGAAPVDLEDTIRRDSFLRKIRQREQPEETLAPAGPVLTEWALLHLMKDVPRRLLELRYLLRKAIDAYGVRWNPDTKQWILPVWNAGGEFIGAQFRQSGSVLTLPEGMAKSETVFGYHVAKGGDYVVLVESPLDAVRLFGLGIPAIASLGAWISEEQVNLMARNYTFVVLALDNDKTGIQATSVARPMLARRGCATMLWDYSGLVKADGEPAKDVGDVPNDDALLDAFDRTVRFGL